MNPTEARSTKSGSRESLEKVMKTASTKRVVTGGVILTIMDILGSLTFTVYNMMMSGLVPSEGAMLTQVSFFFSMLKTFALLGFTGAGAKFISEYLERDKSEARKYGKSAAKYNFILIGIPIILFAILQFIWKSRQGNPLVSHAFFILIFIVIVDRLRTCADTYLLAYQRYDLYSFSFYGVAYGMGYLLAAFTLPFFGPLGPIYSWLISYIGCLSLSLFFVSRVSEYPVRDVFSWHEEFGLFSKMISFNLLYSLANLCFALLTTTLFVNMGDYLHILTDQETHVLGLVSTFSNLLINVFGIVAGIQPAISQAFALKNRRLMKNYFLATYKFPLMMSVAVITFFIIFGMEMIEIFFQDYFVTMGIFIMIFLIPSYAVAAFASRWDNILAGIGRPETAIVPWFVGFFVAIAGFFIVCEFVPPSVYL
ncbi:MAG: hypothetical protein ACTSRA_17195, partial [Promethearchaeota archaeon]